MKTRAILALTALAGLTTAANAQSFTTSTTFAMPLSWSEVNGNGDGILTPGESAAIVFNASFTNQFGTATFSPGIGTFTSGTILGIGSGFVDLNGTGGTGGTFNNSTPSNSGSAGQYGTRSGWRVVGLPASNGSVNASGTGITQIQFGQFVPSPDLANTTNPVTRMFAVLWTPTSYSNRTSPSPSRPPAATPPPRSTAT